MYFNVFGIEVVITLGDRVRSWSFACFHIRLGERIAAGILGV